MARQRNSECVMAASLTVCFLSFVLLFVSCGSVTMAQIPNFPCNFEGSRGSYDFSPYNSTQVKYSHPDGWMFFFQMCSVAPGDSDYHCKGPARDAMMCAVNKENRTNTLAMAYPDDRTGMHEWVEGSPPGFLGVRLIASGGPCFGGTANINLDIVCDPSVSDWPTEFDSMYVGNCGSNPVMHHKSACGSNYSSAAASM